MTESGNPYVLPTPWRQVQVEVTTECTLGCHGCQRTKGVAAGWWASRSMGVEAFETLMRHAPPAGLLVLDGAGEPSLHPRLSELLRLAQDSGKFGGIALTTNGLSATAAHVSQWRDHGLTRLSISVDALDQTVADLVRKGTDVALLEARIAEVLATGMDMGCTIVLSRPNQGHFPSLLARLVALGVRQIEVRPLVAYDDQDRALQLSVPELEQALGSIRQMREQHVGLSIDAAEAFAPDGSRCQRPLRDLYVTVDGFLTPCRVVDDPGHFGRTSLLDRDLSAAWTAPGLAGWMRDYNSREPAMCLGCSNNPSGGYTKAQSVQVYSSADLVRGLEQVAFDKLRQGNNDAAAALYRSQIEIMPTALAFRGLAESLRLQGRMGDAVKGAMEGVKRFPNDLENFLQLAELYVSNDQKTQGLELLHKLAIFNVGKEGHAVACVAMDRLLTIEGSEPYHLPLIHHFRLAGEAERASRSCRSGLDKDPGNLGLQLSLAICQVPVVARSAQECQTQRRLYRQFLEEFCQEVDLTDDVDVLARAADQVGMAKPFFLSYAGQDDRELQGLYGSAVHKIMAARFPQWGRPLPPRPIRPKLRVGFISAYWHYHSISKLFGGWVRHLDRERFELFGYVLDMTPADDWGRSLMDSVDHCRIHKGNSTTGDWAQVIEADALDVLIYLEIGMDVSTMRLAALRLAPVQMTAWGHPVTSGLPTIDAFLSSEAMEPPGAEAHYTETLIRLPGTSLCYLPLPKPSPGAVDRQGMGLDADGIVYICCQTLFKYRPEDDMLLVRIAQSVPKAQFLFIANPPGRPAQIFLDRLTARFAEHGLDARHRIKITGPVPPERFDAFLKVGDVFLDTPHWSGGNTTLEAIQAGLPIVTMAGPFMRGRHSAGILTQYGLGDLVAENADGYVDMAVKLAKNSKARARVTARIQAVIPALFGDLVPVRALETVIADAVTRQRNLG